MLSAQNVTKKYGDAVALDSVSLEPPNGKTTVLIGPSGCGKSTLLRAFIHLIPVDDGYVRFSGEVVSSANALSVRRRVGYVLQDGGLFPHLTARRNVSLLADLLHEPDADERVRNLCSLVHLDESMLDRYPAELSGGQRQRVSLMRALMLDPPVLMLDEPLGALDPMVRAELQRDLRDIFRRLAKTVVMVTHDLAEAAYFADLVVLMRNGRVEQQGTFVELTNDPQTEFVKEFVTAQRELHRTEAGK